MSLPLSNDAERRSLAYFREHASEVVAAIRRSGQPIVLTDLDQGDLVLQDAATFARMKAKAEELATLRAIQEGIDADNAGETMPAADYFEGLKERIAVRR